MIDDLAKVEVLLSKIKSAVPLKTRLSAPLVRRLREQSPKAQIPDRCDIIGAIYSGDEGGILCCLDLGGPDAKTAYVSITHLEFHRHLPLFREIDGYQRRRIKKLGRQGARDR